MPSLTVIGLRVVSRVAATGSITAAARSLGYTQSAVSRQVALMEQAAGVALFERLPRGVRLTARGQVLLRHADAILDRIAAAELDLTSDAETISGRLVLGAFPTALPALVPPALVQLAREHPDLDVRLNEASSVTQLRRLHARRIDVAIIAVGAGLEYDLTGLHIDHLLRGGLRLAVSAEHRFALRGWVSVGELTDETWIVGEGSEPGPQFGPWPTATQARVSYAVRDWPARLGLVAANLGVAVVPDILGDTLPAGVHAIRVDEPRPWHRDTIAVTAPDRSPSVQAAVDALRASATRLITSEPGRRLTMPPP